MASIRDQVERQKGAALIRLEAQYKKLLELFKEIGTPERDWEGRLDIVWKRVNGTMTEEVDEEKRRVRTLTQDIEENGRKLLHLGGLLGINVEEPDEDLSLLELDRVLRVRLEQLERTKQEIVEKLGKIQEEESALCAALDIPPVIITSEVPTETDFREVSEHVRMLRAEQQRRQAMFSGVRQRLFPLLELLERTAEGELELQAVWAPEAEFPLTESSLSAVQDWLTRLEAEVASNQTEADRLRAKLTELCNRLEIPEGERAEMLAQCAGHRPSTLRTLHQQVERLEELKRQNLDKFTCVLRAEIARLWELCFFSEAQRTAFTAYTDNNFTEELLEQHEREVERLKRYYDCNRVLIKDVTEHQKLWKKMLELEERASDPARFNNRGGGLLQEEKERRRIERKLPKLEADLQLLIQRFEEGNNTTFRVYGLDFAEYIQSQKENHELRKEREKEERATKKHQQLEHETLYGARPKTPASRHRRLGVSTRASPSKQQRRLESTRVMATGAPSFVSAASPRRLAAAPSLLSLASPRRTATSRTPLSVFNPPASDVSMARTAPGKLAARLGESTDTQYSEFVRGLRTLQAGDQASPALRQPTATADGRRRRRSQRLAGLPPVGPTPRGTPRTPRLPARGTPRTPRIASRY